MSLGGRRVRPSFPPRGRPWLCSPTDFTSLRPDRTRDLGRVDATSGLPPLPSGVAGPLGLRASQPCSGGIPACSPVLSWGPPPRPTQPRQRSPKCSASRLLIEELNSRVLLGNWLLRAGAERADVISEPEAAAAQPRAPRRPPQPLRPWSSSGCRTSNAGRWRGGSGPFLAEGLAAVGAGS